MANSSKQLSTQDANGVIRQASADDIMALMTTGFLQGKLNNRITITLATTTVPNDTEIVRYFDRDTNAATPSYVLITEVTVVYTDATRTQMLSAERTA